MQKEKSIASDQAKLIKARFIAAEEKCINYEKENKAMKCTLEKLESQALAKSNEIDKIHENDCLI